MGVDIQGKLRLALGSVKDHASIGKAMIYHYQHDGLSDIEIAVLRATGHDHGTIDDKYMHEILFLVANSPGSTPFLAERISRRLYQTNDRLVALKTLVLIHRLLRGGTRNFEQELRMAHVSNHLQINNPGCAKNSYHPSALFLQKYAAYLEERMSWVINPAGKLEPVMSKGYESGCYEEKSIDMVFRRLPKCQGFIDKVLDCSPLLISPSDNLAQSAMSNVLKESFQVYITISEGITELVNMFFGLSSSARRFACEILKKASLQSQKLHDLYENCKKIVENKNLIYLSVQIIDMDHVIAMEQCLSTPLKEPETSHAYFAGKITCSKPPPQVLGCLSKFTGLHVAIAAKPGKKKNQQKIESLSSQTPFSCRLETVVSKVWVVFEDEDTNG